MFRTYKVDPQGPFTSASNAGGLELVDWDNNTIWSYEINTSTHLSHHDAVYMPNGNVLVLTWELVYENELIEMGRDPDEIAPQGFMWSERIMELEPVGNNDANIVWEWHIRDHYIQEFDETKDNYGVVMDHPELFDINLPDLNSSNSNASRDWNHFNAIDYNPDLDQILISVRNSDEIWIIDHSTTTAEAASHSGGKYGKGGDLLYRWGNASAYQRAPVSDQKLFGQHGVHWIREGLQDAGKIMLFNNGNGRPGPDFSTGEVLVPPQDTSGGYVIKDSEPFGPDVAEWIYGDQAGQNFYSPYLSNAQRLPNGNTLLNPGSKGVVFEVNPENEIVWEYVIPLNGDFPYNQGQNPNNNSTFRAYKFPFDFPGFDGQELVAGDFIEIGTNPDACDLFEVVNSFGQPEIDAQIIYNNSSKTLEIIHPQHQNLYFSLFDLNGIRHKSAHLTNSTVSLESLPNGLYIIQLRNGDGEMMVKKIFIY